MLKSAIFLAVCASAILPTSVSAKASNHRGPDQIAATVSDRLAEGETAYLRGRASDALRIWLPLAEAGMASAQYDVGLIYGDRNLVADKERAALWYGRAAEQGFGEAQWKLGLVYARGEGVPRDLVEAEMWIRLSHFLSPKGFRSDRSFEEAERNLTNAQYADASQRLHIWVLAHPSVWAEIGNPSESGAIIPTPMRQPTTDTAGVP